MAGVARHVQHRQGPQRFGRLKTKRPPVRKDRGQFLHMGILMSHFADVSGVVYGKIAGWRGAPDVTVVASMASLSNRPAFDVRGVHSSTGVVIVADTQPIHRAISTLHHEVVAHHGLRAVLGTKWAGFMSAVLDATHAGDESLLLAREMVRETYTDEHGNPNLSLVSEADEMAAAVTEWNTNFSTGDIWIVDPIRKQAKAVAGHLAREVLLMDVPAGQDQLEGAILLAHHHVKHGGLMFGFWPKLMDWYHLGSMSKPTGAKNPPRSVAESEELLAAEDQREGSWIATKGMLTLLIVAGAALIGLWWVFEVLSFVFR